MVVSLQQYLKPLSIVLDVPIEKSHKTTSNHGYGITSTIMNLLNKSKSDFRVDNYAEKAEIQQWIEYLMVYVAYVDGSQNCAILNALNDIFATKTYLVAHRITIADILLYYMLYDVFKVFTHVEKEKYMNISRWFDNVQEQSVFPHSNKLIDFSSNYVATLVPSKH